MAEEFEESGILFGGNFSGEDSDGASNFRSRNETPTRKKTANKRSSGPVSIPSSWKPLNRCVVDSDSDVDDGDLVPPHVIVGRCVARETMSFSVCTGNGRTLKGRDLSAVRNSVLRMTGFLES